MVPRKQGRCSTNKTMRTKQEKVFLRGKNCTEAPRQDCWRSSLLAAAAAAAHAIRRRPRMAEQAAAPVLPRVLVPTGHLVQAALPILEEYVLTGHGCSTQGAGR